MRKAPSTQAGPPARQAVRRSGPSRPAQAAAVPGGITPDHAPLYAALDLGTNNCRLMIAAYANGQFRIIEAFSRIVRLGEGLSQNGQLQERAIERAVAALKICAEKITRRQVVKVRAVATQACRIARNGQAFIRRVEAETGLKLQLITPEEEARLSVIGCASLLDAPAKAAIVLDVGGGSTEISWVELEKHKAPEGAPPIRGARHGLNVSSRPPVPKYWISIPTGVVSLAERFPEPANGDKQVWFDTMTADVESALSSFKAPEVLRPHFDAQDAYIVGTSGAITSLAGLHLRLERYDRSRVDGLWMSDTECSDVIERLLIMGPEGREAEACIGRDRADLVLAGAAILQAVQNLWPCQRLRVADRGLREGLLLSMVRKKSRRRRRGKRKPAVRAEA
ncbi:MAG: Ppx/GppA phosphatase family protein [Asticcacaulis sp.]